MDICSHASNILFTTFKAVTLQSLHLKGTREEKGKDDADVGHSKGQEPVKDNIWHHQCYSCDVFQRYSQSSKEIYCPISALQQN